ncbi:protein arginine methyltransferase NDUFAF7, mitochondrial-like isoform X1 [Corticium candelabrum]|uniref:protein arginine methyltransferase NDUFAF7, mitochondrial-like isoform X1 n=2 Tax=Corticium candelabrum TaxID=121492 RepID=UPI002E254826|nr:protein arginine methyltransferase NDUFAF7, mitochondrial-like isoform X1 [Corticium candelabrum]
MDALLQAMRYYRQLFSCVLMPFIQQRTMSDFSLSLHLRQLIISKGPLTVYNFMRECLTNPLGGYYMHREALGQQGDFTTSPEISQLFGELIGVWCFHVWKDNNAVRPLHIVELGPGRGTLMADILRTVSQFGDIASNVRVSLVEVSPRMMRLQKELLAGNREQPTVPFSLLNTVESYFGPSVSWYLSLDDVLSNSTEFTIIIANEFFDALPVHQFVQRDDYWREILVDIDDPKENGLGSSTKFRFVVSPVVTPALSYLTSEDIPTYTDCFEICPDARVIVQSIAKRLSNGKGIALISDYGSDSPSRLTLRGFKEHKLHDVLDNPGSVDHTVDVDFAALRKAVGNLGVCCGPITQSQFLHQMGIKARLKALMSNASREQGKKLLSGYEMLTGNDAMGERFKFFVVCPLHGKRPYPFI